MLPEDVLVSAIARAVGEPSGGVVLGIGDDAAVLDDGTVVSTDILVEAVHFDLARTTPRDVGHRAATANLSDLAAMGARPVALLAAFGLPPGFDDAAEVAAGMREHGVPVAGGDLARAPVLIVSVTALGRSDRPVRRSGGARRRARRDRAAGRTGRRRVAGRVMPRTDEGARWRPWRRR
jgi:thiamine-monophosphate kinase